MIQPKTHDRYKNIINKTDNSASLWKGKISVHVMQKKKALSNVQNVALDSFQMEQQKYYSSFQLIKKNNKNSQTFVTTALPNSDY